MKNESKFLPSMKNCINTYETTVKNHLLVGVKYCRKVEEFEEMSMKFPINGITPKLIKGVCYDEFTFKRGTVIKFIGDLGLVSIDKSIDSLFNDFIDENNLYDSSIFSKFNDCIRLKMNGVLSFIQYICKKNGLDEDIVKDIDIDAKAYMYYILDNNMKNFCDRVRKAEKSSELYNMTSINIDGQTITLTNRDKKKVLKMIRSIAQ